MAQEQQFQPKWDENTLRTILKSHEQTPQAYSEEYKQLIRQHAAHYNVPFYEGEFEILDAIKEAGTGFVEGFTTLQLGDPPDNEYESIARNLGHLVGFVPGIAAGPLRAMGLMGAAKIAGRLKSGPMFVADKARDAVKPLVKPFLKQGKAAQAGATKTVSDFLLGRKAAHIAEGAFHLGVASAVSSWQGGVDQMMSSFIHGGAAGGVFRTIGNVFGANPDLGTRMVKRVAGGMFMGLPATMRGATTPEQVYEYLLGAWFGGKEQPWTVHKAGKFMNRFVKDANNKMPELKASMDPEMHPSYKELPVEVQPIVKEMMTTQFGDPIERLAMVNELAEQLGMQHEIHKVPEVIENMKLVGETPSGEGIYKPKDAEKWKNFLVADVGEGGSSLFARKASDRGVPAVVLHPKGTKPSSKTTPGTKAAVEQMDLDVGTESINRANLKLGHNMKTIVAQPKKLNRIKQTAKVVRHAQDIYIVGKINKKNQKLMGPQTQWAAQMGIDAGKKVFVYNMDAKTPKNEGWFKWSPTNEAFTRITKPDKPARSFAGFGDKVVTPGGEKAISDFYESSFGKVKVTKTKEKEAKEDSKQIKVSEDDDTGNISIPLGVGERALILARDRLPGRYDNVRGEARQAMMREDAEIIGRIINANVTRTSENRSEDVIAEIQSPKGLGIVMNSKAHGELRQWMNRRNTDVEIDFHISDGKTIKPVNKRMPVTDAGQRKRQLEPLKRIDEVFQEQGGEGRAFSIFDTITIRDKKSGRLIDYEVSTYRDRILPRQNQGKEWIADKKYKQFIGRTMKFMSSEKGGEYFLFGGKGDADRIYWVKWHPEVNKTLKKNRAQFTKELREASEILGKSEIAQLRKEFLIKYSGGKNGFTKAQAADYFNKVVLSNIRYELDMNGLAYNKGNIKKIIGKGFIKNAVAHNKRAQIWFTEGYEASADYLNKWRDSQKRGIDLDFSKVEQEISAKEAELQALETYDVSKLTEKQKAIYELEYEKLENDIAELRNKGGELVYEVREDLPEEYRKLDHRDTSLKNEQLPEGVDGIIEVRSDVVDALNGDAGHPISGQNKSFIVSPHAKHGALLGKYMMHDMGAARSAEMKKKGQHLLIYESGAKQMGTRDFNTRYTMNPKDIKYSYGVYASDHMIKRQQIPKQLLGNLVNSAWANKTKDGVEMNDIINEVMEEVIGTRFRGSEEANKIVADYVDKVAEGVSEKSLRGDLNKIIDNIDNIGLETLIETMKKPGNNRLTNVILDTLFKRKKNEIKESLEEGELTETEANKENLEAEEYYSITHKVIEESRKAANERGKPENAILGYMHKAVRPYKETVIRNFIINSATKPKMNNSGSGFMRPYDEGLRKDMDNVNPRLKELNTNDELFFLDNAHRDMRFHHDIPGIKERITLGELWDSRVKIEQAIGKEQTKELFRAITIRTPADSMSGAQTLEFAGFTGRKGYGILMHSRAMRAEGGADLDGDKSSFFFGGRGGMRKSWKDIYHANKEEFYKTEKGKVVVGDNKTEKLPDKVIEKNRLNVNAHDIKGQTYEDLLTKQYTDKQKKLYLESSVSKFAPNTRLMMSEGAVSGRNLLGGAAVSPKQVMASAFNSIVALGGKDTFTVPIYDYKTKKKKFIEVVIEAKDKGIEKKYARELGRAQVGFSSDPMDYAGLKGYEFWWKSLYDAHFRVNSVREVTTKKGKRIYGKPLEAHKVLKPWMLQKSGVLGIMENANSAFYGRNWSEGRAWTMNEAMEMNRKLHQLPDNVINTITPKIAKLVSTIDYSDHPLSRLDPVKVEKMYKDVNDIVKKYDFMKGMLGRTSFKVPLHKYVADTMRLNLWTPAGLERAAKELNIFREIVAKTPYENITWRNHDNIRERRATIREIRDKSADYLINDLTDMVTIKRVGDIINKMTPAERANVERIHTFVRNLKEESYLMNRDRRSNAYKETDPEIQEMWDKIEAAGFETKTPKSIMRTIFGIRPKEKSLTGILDQQQIDAKIRRNFFGPKARFKSENEKELFDNLMLGSLNRGNLAKLDKWLNMASSKLDEPVFRAMHSLRMNAAKTTTSRLGLTSEGINPKNLRGFMGDLTDFYGENLRVSTKKEVDSAVEKMTNTEKFGEKGYPEEVYSKELERHLTETTGFEGAKEGKVDPEMTKVITDLATMIKSYGNEVLTKNINGVARYLFQKDINLFNKQDFIAFRNWFKEYKDGTFLQRFKKDKMTKLSQRHYMIMPDTVNKELMRDEIELIRQNGVFMTMDSKTMKPGKVWKPTFFIDKATDWIGRAQNASMALSERYMYEFDGKTAFLDTIKEGEKIWQVAVALREGPNAEHIRIREDIPQAEKNAQINEYLRRYKKHKKILDEELGDQKFNLTVGGERKTWTGKELVKKTNEMMTEHWKKMHELISGDVTRDSKGNAIGDIPNSLRRFIIDYYDKKTMKNPVIDYNKFVDYLERQWFEGKDIGLEFGIDGLRMVAKSMHLDMFKNAPKEIFEDIAKRQVDRTGQIPFENYFPHMFFNKKEAQSALKEQYKRLRESTDMTESEINDALKKLHTKHHSLTGDWKFEDIDDWQRAEMALEDIAAGRAKQSENIKWFQADNKAGSMFSRSNHMPGWSTGRDVIGAYTRNIVDSYYRQMNQIFSRKIVTDMERKMFPKWGKEDTNNWTTWLKLHVQGAMGNPDVIPQKVLDNPGMKVKGTPYAWWSDDNVVKKINNVRQKLGIEDMSLPEQLRGVDFNTIRHWSNMEAKFELASLLAHPKTVVNNVFGGSMHTIQSVGFKTFKSARDIKYLRSLNPEWKSKEDIDRFVVESGVLPEWLMQEAGVAREVRTIKQKEFIKEVAMKLKGDPDITSESIRQMGKKAGFTAPFVNFAAKFMSAPERMLRRDAFMSHYLHWYHKFGGAIKDFNDPMLVELAKKGVKATQFLYTAPYRPMFARSALGKVMTRFQLWGWNAVKFRNEALKEARVYGFKDGTDAMEKAVRTMQMDLFVFALGNAFAYSLFDVSMPAPWNWFQDTANWVFGNENERNRAFFGAWPKNLAPLQLVTPPVLRMGPPAMRAMLEDDWSRISDYYVYSMLPFGRLIRDVVGPYNLIENPYNVVQKWTGLPIRELTEQVKD